jgi:hypothetical protein
VTENRDWTSLPGSGFCSPGIILFLKNVFDQNAREILARFEKKEERVSADHILTG